MRQKVLWLLRDKIVQKVINHTKKNSVAGFDILTPLSSACQKEWKESCPLIMIYFENWGS